MSDAQDPLQFGPNLPLQVLLSCGTLSQAKSQAKPRCMELMEQHSRDEGLGWPCCGLSLGLRGAQRTGESQLDSSQLCFLSSSETTNQTKGRPNQRSPNPENQRPATQTPSYKHI